MYNNLNVLSNDFLSDCFIYSNENRIKLAMLNKRGFYIDITQNGAVMLNGFSTDKDISDFIIYMLSSPDKIMHELFCMDSIYNQEVCAGRGYTRWGKTFGSSKLYGDKVSTLYLEPYVARFVHSLALCGIYTYYSCDGWHERKNRAKNMVIGFSDRFSMIWTDVLLKNDIDLLELGLGSVYNFDNSFMSIPFVDGLNRLDVYKRINEAGKIIYAKRKFFFDCKIYLKKELFGKKKSTLSNEQLFGVFEKAFKSYSECHSFFGDECDFDLIDDKAVEDCIATCKSKVGLSI